METRTWNISKDKMANAIEIRSRFGWEEVGRTDYSFTMKREKTPNYRKLKSLESQYNYLNRKFPVGGVVWLIIGLLMLIPAIMTKDWNLNFLVMIPCIASMVIGFFLILAFLIMKPYSKKMIQSIFSEADELAGKTKQFPIPVNLKQGDNHSYEIKKAIYRGDIDFD